MPRTVADALSGNRSTSQTTQLPPQTRLSYRNVSCAIDDGGATVCVNYASEHGFVLSPAGSFAA